MVAHIFYGSITGLAPGFPQKLEAIRQSCSYRDTLFDPLRLSAVLNIILFFYQVYFFRFYPLHFSEYLKYIDLVGFKVNTS